eukprot:13502-Heterococcus_DN1.PRE.2
MHLTTYDRSIDKRLQHEIGAIDACVWLHSSTTAQQQCMNKKAGSRVLAHTQQAVTTSNAQSAVLVARDQCASQRLTAMIKPCPAPSSSSSTTANGNPVAARAYSVIATTCIAVSLAALVLVDGYAIVTLCKASKFDEGEISMQCSIASLKQVGTESCVGNSSVALSGAWRCS